MNSIEEQVKEILEWFLYQDNVKRTDSNNGLIKVYKIGDNLVRVDIRVK